MSSLVILGAGGFLGKALLASADLFGPVKAVVRSLPINAGLGKDGVTWIEADLMNQNSLSSALLEGDIVINLAYISDGSMTMNTTLMTNIIEACISSKVSKLIHCSTAAVVGHTNVNQVNELSECNPSTNYEKVKFSLENLVLSSAARGLDVGIIRPTAIVGAGSQNLVKLACSVAYGNPFINYLKSCVLGQMPMHLVPVGNVVGALLHLAMYSRNLDGNIFIVSSDADVDNNFKNVKRILLKELNLDPPKFPYIDIPKFVQLFIFKLINRNDINMNRTYDSRKIHDLGFNSVDSISVAIKQFANAIELNKPFHKVAIKKVND